MLLYTKIVEENGKKVRKIFAAANNIPAETDSEVTYKDRDGDTLTINANDTYVDAPYIDGDEKERGHGGVIRLSDGKFVSVYAGNVNVVPGHGYTPVAKTLKSIELDTKDVKKEYAVGDKLDLTGLVVKGVYESGEKEVITEYTASPANETVLAAENAKVTITYSEKTAEFAITVKAA